MIDIRTWSPYQQAIFRAVAEQDNSLLVEAVAGSGKTTTIVEAINHVPRDKSVAFLAFNKSIAEELKRRVTAPNARCMTLHSVGFTAWKQFLSWDAGNVTVNAKKCGEIAQELNEESGKYKKYAETVRLVGIAKNSMMVPQGLTGEWSQLKVNDDKEDWEDLVEFYGLDPDDIDIEFARDILRRSIEQSREVIDYDDMLYMPVVTGASFEKYDTIFLDESQDVSQIQVEMVSRMRHMYPGCTCASYYDKTGQTCDVFCPRHGGMEYRKPYTRVVAVGDSNQAIYGFRGALCNSMDQIQERFRCESLPLSVSYRCPRLVVEWVQQWVPHIEWFGDAPAGILHTNCVDWKLKDFAAGDAILCRVSRPTVELAFALIRQRIPAKVIGRDIGQGLIKLIEKMKALSLVDLEKTLAKYRFREGQRPKADASRLATLDDKIATIKVFIDEQAVEIGRDLDPEMQIPALIASINGLFGEGIDGSRMVTLSTVHKAKGLEWDRVFILDADKYMPSPWAREPWQQQQERNLEYVAATRAKRELRYVSSDNLQ